MQGFFKTFNLSEDKYEIIEKISGEKDNKSFAEKNKSLMTGPKRNLYKEYAQDLNYYAEHFDVVKSKLKGKNTKEQREINNKITYEVNEFIEDLIKEEPDQIHQRILEIEKILEANIIISMEITIIIIIVKKEKILILIIQTFFIKEINY